MHRVWVGFGRTRPPSGWRRTPIPSPPAAGRARIRVLQRRPGDEPAAWALVVLPRRPGASVARSRVPRPDRRERRATRLHLGGTGARRRRPPLTEHPAPGRRGGPDRTGHRPGPGRRGDPRGRGRPPGRRAQVVAAPVRVARLPDAAGGDQGRGGQPGRDVDAVARRTGAPTQAAIEREVEYLNALVANLLDISRIEAGALRAERDVYELDDAVRHPRRSASGPPRGPAGSRSTVEPELSGWTRVFLEFRGREPDRQRAQVHAGRMPRPHLQRAPLAGHRPRSRSRTAGQVSPPDALPAPVREVLPGAGSAGGRGAASASGWRWSGASSRRRAVA